MLGIILTIVHVLVCLFLIAVVLLQSGKAADLAGAFGGMGSQTAFGPRGSATLLSKLTTISAALFMITSLSLSILATREQGGGGATGSSVLDKVPAQSQQKGTQPSTKAPTPAPAPGQPGGAQPSVTIIDETTGQKKTVPLNIPPPPGQDQKAPEQKKK
jgi:preprotein translocase subunit SecG